MPRLSIDISEQQHQQLKAIAALSGQSIKDFVLTSTFENTPIPNEMGEEEALLALRGFLETRLQQVQEGQTVERSAADVKARARQIRDGGV